MPPHTHTHTRARALHAQHTCSDDSVRAVSPSTWLSCVHWSWISASRGETTTVSPARHAVVAVMCNTHVQ